MAEIRNSGYAKQLLLFDDMKVDDCTPTDIDAYIEWHNRAHLFFEAKYKGAEVPRGQRLALERLVRDTGRTKPSIAIVFEHEGEPDGVRVSKCKVREYITSNRGIWHQQKGNLTAQEILEAYIELLGGTP